MRRRSPVGSLEDKLKGAAFPWLVIDLQNSRMALAKGRVRSGDGDKIRGGVSARRKS